MSSQERARAAKQVRVAALARRYDVARAAHRFIAYEEFDAVGDGRCSPLVEGGAREGMRR